MDLSLWRYHFALNEKMRSARIAAERKKTAANAAKGRGHSRPKSK